jgi:hypothetical protein
MSISDLDLARLCMSSETDAAGFDFFTDGADTGISYGIVKGDLIDIVCFRGSITFQDWWNDAHAEMINAAPLGLVHAGFYKNMPAVIARIKPNIRPNAVITGHSLGAARAAYAAAMIGSVSQVTLFGCPRPGAAALVEALKDIPVNSYRNRRDPVTELPLPLYPDMPYEHVRPFLQIDGMTDYTLGPPWDDHHIINYMKGIQNGKFTACA